MPSFEFDEAFVPPGAFDRKGDLDVGDAFIDAPSGDVLCCAGIDGKDVYWCGWPYGYTDRKHCIPSTEATPEARRQLLIDLAKMQPENGQHDMRRALARRRLGIEAREIAWCQREERIAALKLLVADARARGVDVSELRRAAELIGRQDEVGESIG